MVSYWTMHDQYSAPCRVTVPRRKLVCGVEVHVGKDAPEFEDVHDQITADARNHPVVLVYERRANVYSAERRESIGHRIDSVFKFRISGFSTRMGRY